MFLFLNYGKNKKNKVFAPQLWNEQNKKKCIRSPTMKRTKKNECIRSSTIDVLTLLVASPVFFDVFAMFPYSKADVGNHGVCT